MRMSAEFLLGLPQVGNLDQLERGSCRSRLKGLVAVEVTVGFLDDDVAFEQAVVRALSVC